MERTMPQNRELDYWMKRVRDYAHNPEQAIKVAELGTDGADSSFEQAFSNLAHAYMRDKAPTLLDHELGFQLLDRNEENTQAVGVMAFKVGSSQLFAPVFFLQGELKGHELLYLKNQDMFVPLKENWLNYVLNRKPNIIGAGIDRNLSALGVDHPQLDKLRNSPYKYAEDVRDFLPVFGHLATRPLQDSISEFADHCHAQLDLGDFMKQASLPALHAVVELMQRKPKIAAAFDRWHGMDVLTDAVAEARNRIDISSVMDDPYRAVNKNQIITGSILGEKTAAKDDDGPDARQKIRVVTMEQSTVDGPPEDLDEEDQEKLLRDGMLIKDHREGEEISVAVNLQVEQKLRNPDETGIYQVLTKPGEFDKCLVVVDPVGPDGRESTCLVVRLEGQKSWGNFDRHDIWVAGQEEEIDGGEESWQSWVDSQSGTSSLSKNGRYMVVGPRRNATCTFRVEENIGDGSYKVDFERSHPRSREVGMRRWTDYGNSSNYDRYDPWSDGQRVHLDAKDGTDLRSSRGDLFVPKDAKVIKVQMTEWDESRKKRDYVEPVCCGNDATSKDSPIQPGNLFDATAQIMKKTAKLRIVDEGTRYNVNGNRLTPRDAQIHLVYDHGLSVPASQELLKTAKHKSHAGNGLVCRVKYANPFLTEGGPMAPSFPEVERGGYNPMGFQGNTISLQEEEVPVEALSASNTDPSVYDVRPGSTPGPMDHMAIADAAASGQKEVFDTAMIGSMLKAVRDDTMIDRYIPDLVKGVDRLGRILFQFYWHQEQFADRYGKQDMPELEDSLRNAFEGLGDVVLFLKQKTIEPYPEEDAQDLNLGDVAS